VTPDTVEDLTTGLAWQRVVGEPLEFWEAEAYCAGLELGGQLDWRLPNRAELSSIHDFTTAEPAQDPAVFDTIPANQFGAYLWTTTPGLLFANQMQTIGQRHGFVASALVEGDLRHVRCVREVAVPPAPEARFDVTEFTVYDQVSGLTWERAPDPVTVIGSAAAATCSARQTGGLDQWRVPSLRELLSIANPAYYEPALNPEFSPPYDERFCRARSRPARA
jgi:hypothetical protein